MCGMSVGLMISRVTNFLSLNPSFGGPKDATSLLAQFIFKIHTLYIINKKNNPEEEAEVSRSTEKYHDFDLKQKLFKLKQKT